MIVRHKMWSMLAKVLTTAFSFSSKHNTGSDISMRRQIRSQRNHYLNSCGKRSKGRISCVAIYQLGFNLNEFVMFIYGPKNRRRYYRKIQCKEHNYQVIMIVQTILYEMFLSKVARARSHFHSLIIAAKQKPSPKTIITLKYQFCAAFAPIVTMRKQLHTWFDFFQLDLPLYFWIDHLARELNMECILIVSHHRQQPSLATEASFRKLPQLERTRKKRVSNNSVANTHIALNSFRLCYYTTFCSFDRSEWYKKRVPNGGK